MFSSSPASFVSNHIEHHTVQSKVELAIHDLMVVEAGFAFGEPGRHFSFPLPNCDFSSINYTTSHQLLYNILTA